jgi:enamine deaminase RidA (YjgF/YER057c/UK114 family)
MTVILPPGWKRPIGYANGVAVPPGRLVFIAGQVGWDAAQTFRSPELVPQFAQALENVLAVLAEARGRSEHICRMTVYCTDKPGYLAARSELGRIWRRLMGRHFPAMRMIFVADLLDHPGKVEIKATAVVPGGGRLARNGQREAALARFSPAAAPLRAKLVAQDLARRHFRQLCDEIEQARVLVRREIALAKREKLAGKPVGALAAVFEHDEGLGLDQAVAAGAVNHCRLDDAGGARRVSLRSRKESTRCRRRATCRRCSRKRRGNRSRRYPASRRPSRGQSVWACPNSASF